jgi:hypothetical protein
MLKLVWTAWKFQRKWLTYRASKNWRGAHHWWWEVHRRKDTLLCFSENNFKHCKLRYINQGLFLNKVYNKCLKRWNLHVVKVYLPNLWNILHDSVHFNKHWPILVLDKTTKSFYFAYMTFRARNKLRFSYSCIVYIGFRCLNLNGCLKKNNKFTL